jgi:hypothetical protein
MSSPVITVSRSRKIFGCGLLTLVLGLRFLVYLEVGGPKTQPWQESVAALACGLLGIIALALFVQAFRSADDGLNFWGADQDLSRRRWMQIMGIWLLVLASIFVLVVLIRSHGATPPLFNAWMSFTRTFFLPVFAAYVLFLLSRRQLA